MGKITYFLSILGVFFFSGCFGSFAKVDVSQEKFGSDVSVGERGVKYIGEAVLNSYEYTELQGAVLLDDYSQSHMMGSIAIKKGDFLKKYKDSHSEESYFCGPYYTPMGSATQTSQICFLDEFDDFENFYILFGEGKYKYGPFATTGLVSYRKSFSVDKSKPFHKVELTYDGVKGGMILFTYKEFTESLTKPAFYSQVRYLQNSSGKPTDISYRNAKIRIFHANNNRIEYKVIEPFSSPQKQTNDIGSEYEKFNDHSGYDYY